MEKNCLNCTNVRKVVMIGCGFVGAACSFAIMQSGLFSEMVLIDADKSKAEGEQRQLNIEKIQSEIDSFPKDTEKLDEETIKKIAREKLNLQDSDVVIFANSQPN